MPRVREKKQKRRICRYRYINTTTEQTNILIHMVRSRPSAKCLDCASCVGRCRPKNDLSTTFLQNQFASLKLLCSSARMKAAQSSPHSPWPSTTPLQFKSSSLANSWYELHASEPTSEHVSIQGHPVNTSQTDTKGDTHVFHHEVGVLHFVSAINCQFSSVSKSQSATCEKYSHGFHRNFLLWSLLQGTKLKIETIKIHTRACCLTFLGKVRFWNWASVA